MRRNHEKKTFLLANLGLFRWAKVKLFDIKRINRKWTYLEAVKTFCSSSWFLYFFHSVCKNMGWQDLFFFQPSEIIKQLVNFPSISSVLYNKWLQVYRVCNLISNRFHWFGVTLLNLKMCRKTLKDQFNTNLQKLKTSCFPFSDTLLRDRYDISSVQLWRL